MESNFDHSINLISIVYRLSRVLDEFTKETHEKRGMHGAHTKAICLMSAALSCSADCPPTYLIDYNLVTRLIAEA